MSRFSRDSPTTSPNIRTFRGTPTRPVSVGNHTSINSRIILKKSSKLQQLSKQHPNIPSDQLRRLRKIFNTLNNGQPIPVEKMSSALKLYGYDDIQENTLMKSSFYDFLANYELMENGINFIQGLLDFEHFSLLILEYEENIKLEEEALRKIDWKVAFECFDVNKDGVIDAEELGIVMKIIGLPVTDRETKEMVKLADLNRDKLINFDEFIGIMTTAQITPTIRHGVDFNHIS